MLKHLRTLAAGAALAAVSAASSAAIVGAGNVSGNYTLNTSGGAVSQSSIESFLGLAVGALDSLGQGNAIEGSAIKDSQLVGAGSTLSFNWSWTSDESSGSSYNDFAFVTINIGGTTVIANTFTPDGTTGLFSFIAPTAGTMAYGIGVMDVRDSLTSSRLTISNLNVSSNVPEPASLALVGLALGALGLRRRKN